MSEIIERSLSSISGEIIQLELDAMKSSGTMTGKVLLYEGIFEGRLVQVQLIITRDKNEFIQFIPGGE